ncbi:MAG: DUF6155 family protein [Marinifilaceae bacterium]|jgi:hypothetical protein
MSKRELKIYLNDLTKEQLQDQILDLYGRFKEVKEYYDFAFNPKEDKLLEQCKFQISKEYFPVNGRKPKARRSVAQKQIRHFKRLGMDSHLVADIMLYNLEIAQAYSNNKIIKSEAFYTSMLKSFEEAVAYIQEHGLMKELATRIEKIASEAWNQDWINKIAFERLASSQVG